MIKAIFAFFLSLSLHAAECADNLKSLLRDDYRQALNLQNLDPSTTITLAVGAPGVTPDAEEESALRHLVRQIIARNFTILYDADAGAGPIIADEGQTYAIGISGNPARSGEPRLVVIENVSLRLDAFLFRFHEFYQRGHRMLVRPDSLVGLALLLQNPRAIEVWNAGNLWHDQLESWATNLGDRAKRLKLNNFKRVSTHTINSVQCSYLVPHRAPDRARLRLGQSSLGSADTQLMYLYANEVADGIGKGVVSAGGTVVFCSAIGDSRSDTLLREVAVDAVLRGRAIVTGGSIASMQVVNQAAKNAGGVSIGLPIQRAPDHREFVIPTFAHTLTHVVGAHPARLKLLLGGRDQIVFGPGGKGVMRELGAVLVDLATGTNRSYSVEFIDELYFRELFDFIQSLPLPRATLSRFSLSGL